MKKKAFILNLIIFILELIGLIMTFVNDKRLAIEFYTNDSNIIMLICSGLYIVYYVLKKEIPKWLQTFRFICTSALAVTFIVVVLVLAPMYDFSYGWMLFYKQLIIYHTLGPILSIVSFIFFEKYHSNKVLPAITYTFVYGIIMIILNIFKIVDGPYPFLRVYEQSATMSVLWFFIILGVNYVISYSLLKLNKKSNIL